MYIYVYDAVWGGMWFFPNLTKGAIHISSLEKNCHYYKDFYGTTIQVINVTASIKGTKDSFWLANLLSFQGIFLYCFDLISLSIDQSPKVLGSVPKDRNAHVFNVIWVMYTA